MKLLIAFTLWLLSTGPNLEKIRSEYALVGLDQEHVKNIWKLCSRETGSIFEAYNAGAEMASAQFLNNPIQKLSVFHSGKKKLENILTAPENAKSPEIRFIRYSVQLKCPAILGYNKNLKEDKAFLIKAMPNLKNSEPTLWKYILGFLLLHDSLTSAEKQALGF